MIFADSDVMIDVFREYPPAVAWLLSLGTEPVILSGFVAMELIQGCRDKGQQRRIERRLSMFRLLWPAPQVCNDALAVFARYHLSHNLGLLDAWIGHQAVALNLPLHTINQKHYASIPNLQTVQPYAR